MQLEFFVPIFDFNYIGENLSLKDMWKTNANFHKNFKDYLIDSEHNIVIKRFDELMNWENLNIDVLSKIDS